VTDVFDLQVYAKDRGAEFYGPFPVEDEWTARLFVANDGEELPNGRLVRVVLRQPKRQEYESANASTSSARYAEGTVLDRYSPCMDSPYGTHQRAGALVLGGYPECMFCHNLITKE
jgi:hypothetical protein